MMTFAERFGLLTAKGIFAAVVGRGKMGENTLDNDLG